MSVPEFLGGLRVGQWCPICRRGTGFIPEIINIDYTEWSFSCGVYRGDSLSNRAHIHASWNIIRWLMTNGHLTNGHLEPKKEEPKFNEFGEIGL